MATQSAAAVAGVSTGGLYAMAWLAQAYRALVSNPGSPARIASFRLATRNLSNTLEVPLERTTERILFRSGQADQGPEQQ